VATTASAGTWKPKSVSKEQEDAERKVRKKYNIPPDVSVGAPSKHVIGPGRRHYIEYAEWATPEEKQSGLAWGKNHQMSRLSDAEHDIKEFYKKRPEYRKVTTQGPEPTTFGADSWDELTKVNDAYRRVGRLLKGMAKPSELRKQNGMLEVDAMIAPSRSEKGWSIQARLLEGYQKELPGYPEAAVEEEEEEREDEEEDRKIEESRRQRRQSSDL
jgi:hypothetical protein